MPVTLSIQALIDAQTTAINANVTSVVNAARDNVKADNVTQITAQTTAINSNVDTDFAAVQAAVNAKGVVKSVQRGVVDFSTGGVKAVTIAAVDPAKSMLILHELAYDAPAVSVTGVIGNATQINLTNRNTSANTSCNWQVVEYF